MRVGDGRSQGKHSRGFDNIMGGAESENNIFINVYSNWLVALDLPVQIHSSICCMDQGQSSHENI